MSPAERIAYEQRARDMVAHAVVGRMPPPTVELRRCWNCDGSGQIFEADYHATEPCGICRGYGRVQVEVRRASPLLYSPHTGAMRI